jgi:proline dehydrogenase
MRQLKLCKCGCGIQVEKSRKKYFGDHYKNPIGSLVDGVIEESVDVVVPVIKEIVIAKEKVDVTISPVSKKHSTRTDNCGKISKQNLRNAGLNIYVN